MNPGLVVKLRPAGPWRIGPGSGARNRVDSIFHSDSLYSAVTSAMARLGSLDDWLSATARAAAPAVCFSSCFPFLDEIGFVVPPRSIWPPATPALMAARVRWKSARFVPLEIVRAMLAGQNPNEHQWSVDGASECLVPAGRSGPFRMDTRWNAAVDRLTGASERHSTACIEFRPGAGLWTVVSFLDDAARDRWMGPVQAAFRLLADTGFGGERSRGWGRSEAPEFIEGQLPEMILPPPPAGQAEIPPDAIAQPEPTPETAEPVPVEAAPEPEAVAESEANAVPEVIAEPEATAEPEAVAEPEVAPLPEAIAEPEAEAAPVATEPPPAEESPEIVTGEASVLAPPEVAPLLAEPASAPVEPPAVETPAPEPVPPPQAQPPAPATVPEAAQLHWLLSLFSPAPGDAVDWTRGNYAVQPRGGRVESPSGSGELKKLVQMVTEGSVLSSGGPLIGAAPDVAPDGFAHPVFRAGFAVAIPLPAPGVRS